MAFEKIHLDGPFIGFVVSSLSLVDQLSFRSDPVQRDEEGLTRGNLFDNEVQVVYDLNVDLFHGFAA